MGQTRDFDVGLMEEISDVVRGALTVDGRVQGKNDLADCRVVGTLDERVNRQIFGADAVERRQGSAEYVIAAVKSAGAFEGPQIRQILDDANDATVASGIAADFARIMAAEIAADRAAGWLKYGQAAGHVQNGVRLRIAAASVPSSR